MESCTRVPAILLWCLTIGCRLAWGLVGRLHGSVGLPCVHPQLPGPIEQFNVYWQQKIPGSEDLVVATLVNGLVHTGHVNEKFRGRSHLCPERVKTGNFSLTLTNLTHQDSGSYVCIVLWMKDHVTQLKDITAELEVTAGFSTPVVGDLTSAEHLPYGQERTLTCTSQGAGHLPRIIWISGDDNNEVQDGRVQQEVQQNGEIINVSSTITLNISSHLNILCVIVTKDGNVTSEPSPKNQEL
ncbi:ICOS ligand-like isoform X2 [Dendropsophus ebraccatus]|uniref:ICOS ligand-like isoform X2 n=1 Tax=Dendropsophus ebraccatus TaxID=150705 RepID=UPI003831BC9D